MQLKNVVLSGGSKKWCFDRLESDMMIFCEWLMEGVKDIFKLAKNAFSLKNLHRYTKRSVKKFVCLHVLLVGIVVSLGINSKEELQKIAEW